MIIKQIVRQDYAISSIAGVLHGILIWALFQTQLKAVPITIALVFTIVFNVTFLLSFKKEALKNSIVIAVISSFIFAIITGTRFADVEKIHFVEFGLLITQIISLYIIIPFIQIWVDTKKVKFPYHDLFNHSWNNYFIVSTAWILLGMFWLLIFLWIGLFEILGIDIFREVFLTEFFVIVASSLILALGVNIGRTKHKIVNSLRSIILSLCHLLLPIIISIAVLFLLSLVLTGGRALFETGMTTPLITSLMLLVIFFINGIFQDGSKSQPLNKTLTIATNITILVLPIYSLIVFYALYLRIDQYGLTPQRFLGIVVVVLTSLYSFSYSYCIYKRTNVWLEWIKKINVILSIIVFVIALAVNTSLLNPVKHSAYNQYNRLILGKVSADEFDYGYLYYELGRHGKKMIEKLHVIESHPQIEIIREKLRFLATTNYYNKAHWDNNRMSVTLDYKLKSIPEGRKIPEDLYEFLRGNKNYNLECSQESCILLFINLDNDLQEEAVFFNSYKKGIIIDKVDHSWKKTGRLNSKSWNKLQNLEEKLKSLEHDAISNKYKSLRIGKEIWYFNPR